MEIEEIEATYKNISTNIGKLATEIDSVKAIGVSGSFAREGIDQLSDIDLCVYVADELPTTQKRKRAYAELGFNEEIYFDVDFETSRGDGFWVNAVRCDFNWMSIASIQLFLGRLETDFDSPEYLPGGLQTVKKLYDPDHIIPKLQMAIPAYSDERAKYRIKKAIDEVYFSLYDLKWLEKAVYRNDYYLFLKYQEIALGALFRVLFALNKVWLSDEKGLTSKIGRFQYSPEQIENRVNAIIMQPQENSDLGPCLHNLKKLFADTVIALQKIYPELELPIDWK